jgi:WD40 repeat protein
MVKGLSGGMERCTGVTARPIVGISGLPSDAALSHELAAVPDHRVAGDVLVFGPGGAQARLCGFHSSRVTGLCFAEGDIPRLYTVATDGLAGWAIQCIGNQRACSDEICEIRVESPQTIVAESLNEVPEHIAADGDGRRLAVCAGKATRVVSVMSGKVLARLEGHGANVIAAAFRGGDHKVQNRGFSPKKGRNAGPSSGEPAAFELANSFSDVLLVPDATVDNEQDVVVSIGEDRRFIVYDLKGACIIYASAIVSAAPFTTLAIEQVPSHLLLFISYSCRSPSSWSRATTQDGHRCAVGSADGVVRCFDLSTPECRLVHQLSLPEATGQVTAPRTQSTCASPMLTAPFLLCCSMG